MDLLTMSLDEAESHVPAPGDAIISISFSDQSMDPVLHRGYCAVLPMYFDDLANRVGTVEITAAQAKQIVEFATTLKDRPIPAERLLIHCLAGVSRSVSVAMALADGFRWSYVNRPRAIDVGSGIEAGVPNGPVYDAVAAAILEAQGWRATDPTGPSSRGGEPSEAKPFLKHTESSAQWYVHHLKEGDETRELAEDWLRLRAALRSRGSEGAEDVAEAECLMVATIHTNNGEPALAEVARVCAQKVRAALARVGGPDHA